MRLKFIITGPAVLVGIELRCTNRHPYHVREGSKCDKLMAKKNKRGHLAGSYKCERCHAKSEVLMEVA